MQVILLEKIRNLGNIGDAVTVKSGYARNFLLPQAKAISATPESIAEFEKQRQALEHKAKEQLAAAKNRAEILTKLPITISVQANEDGNLFGSVGIQEIVAAIREAGGEIDKKEIMLPEGVIHQIGEYEINLQLHSDGTIPIKINVIPQQNTN